MSYKDLDSIEELIVKLELILSALRQTSKLSIFSSPLDDLLMAISDLLSITSSIIGQNKGIPVNSGLSFEEFQKKVPAEDQIEDFEFQNYLHSDFPLHRFSDADYLWDPVENKFYSYSADPLGNPLQVKIEFPNHLKLNHRESQKLRIFFEELQSIFAEIALGHVQWRFINSLHRTITPKSSYHEKKRDTEQKRKSNNRKGYSGRKRGKSPSSVKTKH